MFIIQKDESDEGLSVVQEIDSVEHVIQYLSRVIQPPEKIYY